MKILKGVFVSVFMGVDVQVVEPATMLCAVMIVSIRGNKMLRKVGGPFLTAITVDVVDHWLSLHSAWKLIQRNFAQVVPVNVKHGVNHFQLIVTEMVFGLHQVKLWLVPS
jgi:hypothetical protein